jgi:hypothetical protein
MVIDYLSTLHLGPKRNYIVIFWTNYPPLPIIFYPTCMWKTLNNGDRVIAGDSIRYRLGSSRFTGSPDVLYEVVKTDQHYFEVAARTDDGTLDKTDRKIIKYMDVGYHIKLEVWSDKSRTGIFIIRVSLRLWWRICFRIAVLSSSSIAAWDKHYRKRMFNCIKASTV